MTLIELLIALAIGTIMILAISRVYLAAASGVRDYRDRVTLSNNVRLLHERLDYEIRRADFWGRVPADAPRSGAISIAGDCRGAFAFGREDDDPPDVPRGIWASTNTPQGCNLGEALESQTFLVLRYAAESCATDCSGNAAVQSFYPSIVFYQGSAGDEPVNADPMRDRWRYGGSLYYLRRDDNGEPALWRLLLQGGSLRNQEVLKGVEALAFRWAIDTDGDGRVNTYEATIAMRPSDMPDVVGLEVEALVSAAAPPSYRDSLTYTLIDGQPIQARPGKRYRAIRFLVPLDMHRREVIDG